MNDPQTIQSPPKRKEKPAGVPIIATFDFVAVGLIPLIATLWIGLDNEIGMSLANLVLTLSLAVFTMIAAIWTWAGDNQGRLLLLGLVTVTSVLVIINNITFIVEGNAEGSGTIRLIGNVFRGLFWIGINWWYFNRKKVIDYYKRAI
jgi:hypothetical protein